MSDSPVTPEPINTICEPLGLNWWEIAGQCINDQDFIDKYSQGVFNGTLKFVGENQSFQLSSFDSSVTLHSTIANMDGVDSDTLNKYVHYLKVPIENHVKANWKSSLDGLQDIFVLVNLTVKDADPIMANVHMTKEA